MEFRISKPLLLLLLLLLGGSFLIGGIIAHQYGIIDLNYVFCDVSRFSHINPELACGTQPAIKKYAYAELKGKLEKDIQIKISEQKLSDFSLYLRDLENGPTLGINEHVKFIPASLLKVPLFLTYIALSEENPQLLGKRLTYHTLKNIILDQKVVPSSSIKENTSYTISELLRYMIVYSDNNAYYVLLKYLQDTYPDGAPYYDTIRGLGIIEPQSNIEETITVKSYASIFVQLYNSSFFDKKESSESALALLAQTDFTRGLVAGVPKGMVVAHKFGERVFTDSGTVQLHDCGIVYYPKNPYLLCIMTRGRDLRALEEVIGSVSKTVYEEFDLRSIK